MNLAEVVAVLVRRGVSTAQARDLLDPLGLEVCPFDVDDAYRGGEIALATKAAGLSLGDRACLGLAKRLGRPALTADRSWSGVKVGVKVVVVR